jgi:hypothetical protein
VSTLDFEVRVLGTLGLLDGGSGRQVGPYVGAHTGCSSTAARSRWARSHGPLLVPLGNARLCSGQVVDNRCARGSTGRRRRAASSPRGARPARPSAGPMPRRPTKATRQRSARPTRPAGGLGRRRRRGRTPMPFPGRAPPRWSASRGPGRALSRPPVEHFGAFCFQVVDSGALFDELASRPTRSPAPSHGTTRSALCPRLATPGTTVLALATQPQSHLSGHGGSRR